MVFSADSVAIEATKNGALPAALLTELCSTLSMQPGMLLAEGPFPVSDAVQTLSNDRFSSVCQCPAYSTPFIWAAWYITRLLVKLKPKGVIFLFFSSVCQSSAAKPAFTYTT